MNIKQQIALILIFLILIFFFGKLIDYQKTQDILRTKEMRAVTIEWDKQFPNSKHKSYYVYCSNGYMIEACKYDTNISYSLLKTHNGNQIQCSKEKQ